MILEILFIIIGFIFLIKGADFLVKVATTIAKKFNLSEILIGLTIVAIGTSLPEIFITITSSIEKHSDLIIANSIGSCICNFLFVLGVSSLIKPIKLEKRIVKVHLLISIFIMLLILFLGNMNRTDDIGIIEIPQGIILILFACFYIIYTIYEENKIKNNKLDKEIIEEVENIEIKEQSFLIIFLYIIIGLLGLKFGSDFVVNNSIVLAKNLGFSESFIGITIVAIGTTLPEIVTGIVSAKKGKTDLLFGNIIGSNIINLCLLIGIGAIINPLIFNIEFNRSLAILIGITIVLQLIGLYNKKRQISKITGGIFVFIYVLYIFSMV